MNFSDLILEHVNDGINGFVAMKFKCEITDEVCNLIGKPRVNFGGHYTTNGETLVFGTGFLFKNMNEAESAVNKIFGE